MASKEQAGHTVYSMPRRSNSNSLLEAPMKHQLGHANVSVVGFSRRASYSAPSPRGMSFVQGDIVETVEGIGVVQYVGEVEHFGVWVGVEFAEPAGNCDGTFNGHQYFHCAPSHGIFVKSERLNLLSRDFPTIEEPPASALPNENENVEKPESVTLTEALVEEKEITDSLTKLVLAQKVAKRFLKNRRESLEKMVNEEEAAAHSRSAVNIQRCVRGHFARKKVRTAKIVQTRKSTASKFAKFDPPKGTEKTAGGQIRLKMEKGDVEGDVVDSLWAMRSQIPNFSIDEISPKVRVLMDYIDAQQQAIMMLLSSGESTTPNLTPMSSFSKLHSARAPRGVRTVSFSQRNGSNPIEIAAAVPESHGDEKMGANRYNSQRRGSLGGIMNLVKGKNVLNKRDTGSAS